MDVRKIIPYKEMPADTAGKTVRSRLDRFFILIDADQKRIRSELLRHSERMSAAP